MARVTLKMDVHSDRAKKKIEKGLKSYVYGVDRVVASVDSGLVVIWGSADAVTLKEVLQSLMKKPVTIVPDEEESPAPAAQSSSDPPPAEPSQQLTPGHPPQYYPQHMWPPPPQFYGQQPPPMQYYQLPSPAQFYQPPPPDHPQYATPPLPHNSNPRPAGPRRNEHPYACSIQ